VVLYHDTVVKKRQIRAGERAGVFEFREG
jgi:hypothetical protein